jgi:hypothetical protein
VLLHRGCQGGIFLSVIGRPSTSITWAPWSPVNDSVGQCVICKSRAVTGMQRGVGKVPGDIPIQRNAALVEYQSCDIDTVGSVIVLLANPKIRHPRWVPVISRIVCNSCKLRKQNLGCVVISIPSLQNNGGGIEQVYEVFGVHIFLKVYEKQSLGAQIVSRKPHPGHDLIIVANDPDDAKSVVHFQFDIGVLMVDLVFPAAAN